MKSVSRNRFSSIPKRSFRNSIIRLLEENYKILGSHKVLQMIADDIVECHKEFYPDLSECSFGSIVWQTTAATEKKPSYGTRVEDQRTKTVILPLITEQDIEDRMINHYRNYKNNSNQKKQVARDITVMARLVKSAYEQGGLLTGAELAVLLNRALHTIGRYLKKYHETHDDILPTKGIILDQGSNPTHKASIVDLHEQGYPDPDIARLTNHTLESVGRYLRAYKNVRMLMEKGFTPVEMVRVTGKALGTIHQYKKLVLLYHPELSSKAKRKRKEKT